MIRKLFRYKGTVAVVGILYWFLFLRFVSPPPLPISPETTHFTSPLDAAGNVDFDLAMNARFQVPAAENAALPLLEIFGSPLISPDEKDVDGFCRCLGIASEAIGTGVFRFPEPAVATSGAGSQPSPENWPESNRQAFLRPWSAAEFPSIAAWIDRNDETFSRLERMAERPGFFWPHIPGKAPYDGNLFPAKQITVGLLSPFRLLRARGMRKLAAGDGEGAWKDLFTALRAGRHLLNNDYLIAHLIGILQWKEALDGLAVLINSPAMTTAQLETSLADLESLGPLPDGSIPLEAELRILPLAALLHWKRTGFKHPTAGTKDLHGFEEYLDVMRMARRLNQEADTLMAAVRIASVPARIVALNGWTREQERWQREHSGGTALLLRCVDVFLFTTSWKKVEAFSLMIHDIFRAVAMPRYLPLLWENFVVAERLTLVKLAARLQLFRRRTGDFPASLNALAELGFTPPPDSFTGRPLAYRKASGTFVLYSVGPDQTDDGGRDTRDVTTGDVVLTSDGPGE